MDKLSELSKPVAWTWHAYGLQHATTEEDERDELIADGVENSPLYSQDYVSALLAELEAKDKRITTVTEEREFWRERVDGAEKEREEFRRRFNLERSCLEDADKRIAELEAKLATPVRFPKRWDVSGQVNPPRIVEVQFEQQNRTHDQCAKAIRNAGFTVIVEGDE